MGIRTAGLGAVAIALAIGAGAARADIIELRNDSFESGAETFFQDGFVLEEIAAVRLVPPGAGPYRLLYVQLLFGGMMDGAMREVTVHVWQDTGGVSPGTETPLANDYTLTASDSALHEIDLTAEGVFVTGPFRIGIEFQHGGLPSVSRDADGLTSGANFIYACIDPPDCFLFTWVQSETFGVPGDWVIRAVVDGDPGGPAPDAAIPPAPDAAPVPDAPPGPMPDATIGAPDAAAPAPDAAGGASCNVHSECPTGQHCGDDNQCAYDCRVDFDCGDGYRCTSLGYCELTDDGGGCCRVGGDRAGPGAVVPIALALVVGLLLFRRRT